MATGSGSSVFGSPRHSSLTQSAPGLPRLVEQFAGQAGVADRVLGAEAAGRVRQDRVALQVEVVEDVAAFLVDQPFAAHGHRRHLAAAGGQAVAHQVVAGVLAGAGDEPAVEA